MGPSPMKRLTPWLALSLLIGIAALVTFLLGFFVLPSPLTQNMQGKEPFIWALISFGLSALWAAALVPAVAVLRRRGLWFLIGMPCALFGPISAGLFVYYVSECQKTRPPLKCTYEFVHFLRAIDVPIR